MKLTWHGHACCTVETTQGTLVIDPYEDNYVPGLAPIRLSADQVVCTHQHRDHNAVQIVTLTGNAPTYHLTTLETFHDEVQGAKRGKTLMFLLEAEGMRLAHLGDIGGTLTAEQMEQLKDLDVLLIPVGGFYTIGPKEAQELIQALNPRIVVPMHYRSDTFGYDVLATVEDFLALRNDAVRYEENWIQITPETKGQTAVLTYQAP